MGKKINLLGQKFGRLTVVGEAPPYVAPNGRKSASWVCRCDCGEIVMCGGYSLRSGHTKSCGCYKRETAVQANIKHGQEGTRLYDVWINMKQRCENPNNSRFGDYGGRGITICAEWHEFGAFAEWAYSHGYDKNAKRGKCTIDRVDNDKGYCPGNCEFKDMSAQRKNQRRMKK
jgi:hypothetical protein